MNTLAQYRCFSTFDLKSAYHQIPIHEEDKSKTAFEANGKLYQFTRIPFGVTNGVAVFQRVINEIIEKHQLKDTYAYLDNVTVAGRTQEEHDTNVAKFLEVTKQRNLTLNHEKTISSTGRVKLLRYELE